MPLLFTPPVSLRPSRAYSHPVCSRRNAPVALARNLDVIRIAVPSKGDILEDTKSLLSDVGIDVVIRNPRQYVADLKGLDVQVWLQRPPDIVRKVKSGDVDLGFVGYDLVREYGGVEREIVAVHDRLGYGDCRLSLAVPMRWGGVRDIQTFREKSVSLEGGVRIATKYDNEAKRFLKNIGIDKFSLVKMEGALEAATQMGTADCIVDLVSSGTTLRENLLKEVQGGTILESSMQLVGNRAHLQRDDEFGQRLRDLTKELVERIEAHLLGKDNYNIIANIRGSSMVDVSRKLATQDNLRGVDGPTVSPVVPPADSDEGMYAISIVLPKSQLYSAIQQLRSVGGSGVTVLPVSFVFPQKCRRWEKLVKEIGLSEAPHIAHAC